MDVIEAIHTRRAVRNYANEPLPRETAKALIEAAAWAPTARDQQAWGFVVARDRAKLRIWSEEAKAHMLRVMGGDLAQVGFRAMVESRDFNIFYNAPALIVVCATSPDPMAREDCCLAAENLMLAARGMGLGSCWIGFAEAWLNLPEGRAELGLPESWAPIAPIIVGKPAGDWPPAPARRTPESIWIG
jgi:nitroreductase